MRDSSKTEKMNSEVHLTFVTVIELDNNNKSNMINIKSRIMDKLNSQHQGLHLKLYFSIAKQTYTFKDLRYLYFQLYHH